MRVKCRNDESNRWRSPSRCPDRVFGNDTNEAIAKVQSEWNENGHVKMPADLEDQVRNLMIEKPELPWDQAVSRMASPDDDVETEEAT